jgi:uncharacterized protein YggE
MDVKSKSASYSWKEPRGVLFLVGILVIGTVMTVSIVRDRIVNPTNNQITVTGRGIVPYQPDKASVTIGVQIDKSPTAEDALNQLNAKMAKIVSSLEAIGVPKDNVQTQTYTVAPQYDFRDNVSVLAGYNANQRLVVKVEGIGEDNQQVSKVIAETSKAGANQVLGVEFDVASISDLKQKARLAAIADARKRAPGLANAAGVRLDKVAGWYETVLQEPGRAEQIYGYGSGGEDKGTGAPSSPQIPTGTQEIIIEVGMNYIIK